MGTNFYRKMNFGAVAKKKMHDLVDAGKLTSNWDESDDIYSSVSSMIDALKGGVHICKRSSGWFMCFDHNWGKYYEPTRESLGAFLSEPGYHIEDEYGDEYTAEEFWKMVDEWDSSSKINGEPLWDSAAYGEWEKSQGNKHYICHSDIDRVAKQFGIHCTDNDFVGEGGIRFAVYSDFC